MNHAGVSSPPAARRAAGLSHSGRTTSTTDLTSRDNGVGNQTKRRSSRACQCCRLRKIKCDALECGVPCQNCIVNETQCVMIKSKWRRGRIIYKANPQHVLGPRVPVHGRISPDIPTSMNYTSIRNAPSNQVRSHVVIEIDSDDGVSMTASSSDHLEQSEMEDLVTNNNQQDNDLPTDSLGDFALASNLATAASFCGDLVATVPEEARPTPSNHASLPSYIKPLPDCMTADDIHYIWKKGALSIPERVLQDALIRCYIEFVYPYMPAIELYDFLQIIEHSGGEGETISLLLFQAIMFAGTAFVDVNLLEAAGYVSRKAARKAFYQKVKILYDSEYETDCIANVQCLLLMTYWYERPDDLKDTWHWMGIAVSVAQTIGLHRNPEQSQISINTQRLWRRIWWSCFMRDQLVALGLSRSPRIKYEDHDIPMLTLEDFNIGVLSTFNIGLLADCSLIRDTLLQTDLALMCIAKAKLCVCISHVLSKRCYNLVRDQGLAHRDKIRANFKLVPEKMRRDENTQLYDDMLMEWNRSLAAPYSYVTPSVEENSRCGTSFLVQRALLHMLYFAAVSALHRFHALPTHQSEHHFQDYSRKKAREASQQIGRISRDLLDLKLEGFLPTSSLTVLLPASMLHLLNIKSSDDAARKEALQGFCNCVQVVEKLRDKYCAADFACGFLEAAMRKTDLKIAIDGGLPKEVVPGESREWTTVREISQLVQAAHAERLGAEGFSPLPALYFSSSRSRGRERDFPHVQTFDSANGFFDIFGTEQNQSVGSLTNEFDDGNVINNLLWDSSLEGITNCESGGALVDMQWLFDARDGLL